MEGVAQNAGVSKVTVYKWFPNKGALFEAVVRGEADAMITEIRKFRKSAGSGNLSDRLIHFGMTLFGYLVQSDSIRFDNMVAAERARSPELARHFFLAGPKRMHDELKNILSNAETQSRIGVRNARQAAGDLIGLWRGFEEIEERFGWKNPPTGAQMEERIKRGVTLFLRLHQKDTCS